jgi:hypothetical protein
LNHRWLLPVRVLLAWPRLLMLFPFAHLRRVLSLPLLLLLLQLLL